MSKEKHLTIEEKTRLAVKCLAHSTSDESAVQEESKSKSKEQELKDSLIQIAETMRQLGVNLNLEISKQQSKITVEDIATGSRYILRLKHQQSVMNLPQISSCTEITESYDFVENDTTKDVNDATGKQRESIIRNVRNIKKSGNRLLIDEMNTLFITRGYSPEDDFETVILPMKIAQVLVGELIDMSKRIKSSNVKVEEYQFKTEAEQTELPAQERYQVQVEEQAEGEVDFSEFSEEFEFDDSNIEDDYDIEF
ncbi:hypothetical protein [Thomasclavelia sp.]|uniref:hypothetical protein n=1 Tax=Thomasclavelia sp. TaxID=3025757 RepID=UPI0025D0887E|nr:hypothetical protein [Thomasclavelia sp.]